MKRTKGKIVKFKEIYVIPHWFGRATLYALGADGFIYSAKYNRHLPKGDWTIRGMRNVGEIKNNK